MKNLTEQNFKGKIVIVRVDFNVPLNGKFEITDDSRIAAALPTIKQLLGDNAKVILMSHLGRPKENEEKFSLKHLVSHLESSIGVKVSFSENCIGETAKNAVDKLNYGEVLLLENLRFHKEEKEGNVDFAKQLSELADVYVNDAFGTAHRAHSSTSVISQFFPENKYFGLLLKNEIDSLEQALTNAEKPFTAIIGGAKISGKIDVITSLLLKVDNLIIGGGMAYTFSKAMGGKIGNSLVENDKVDLAKNIIEKAKELGVNLLLPIDSVNADDFNNNANIITSEIINVPEGFMGLDIGDKSIQLFSETIQKSKTIIWNGPMGVFEMSNFENGTKKIGEAICKSTEEGAFSLIGGGAMLEYLEGKELPGVKSIQE